MLLWYSLAFSIIQQMLGIWYLVSLPFLNPAWTSGSSRVLYYWSLAWRILSITLSACEMSAIVQYLNISWQCPSLGWNEIDILQSCGHCWVFQICWYIEYSTFTASSLRIWYSSTGVPSPVLVLFVVMLPTAHLTLNSRMSGSRWVITPSWLSGPRLFCTVLLCTLATSS